MTIVENLFKLIDDGRDGLNKGLPTGLPKLDDIVGGAQRAVYTTVFGLSSTGKTSFIVYSYLYRVLKDNPDKDVTIIHYSLEVNAEIIYAKLLSLYVYEEFGVIIPYLELLSKTSRLSDEKFEYVNKAKSWLESLDGRLIIFDKALNAKTLYKTAIPILEKKGTVKEEKGRKVFTPNNPEQIILLLLDHASILLPSDGRTLKQEIDLTSQYLITLRNRYFVSPVVLMQQNRESSSMDRRKADLTEPSMNDSRDSGNVIQDSDIVLALYSPLKDKLTSYRGYKVLGDEGLFDRIKGCVVLKNRYGISDKVVILGFYGEVGKFVELPPPDEIDVYQYKNLVPKKRDIQEEKPLNDKKLSFKF